MLHLKDSRSQGGEDGGGGSGGNALGRGHNRDQVVGEGRIHFQRPVVYVTGL